jgi:hypothetical protein
MSEIKPSMFLYKSHWGEMPTFKMLPLMESCPYTECIFDPMGRILAVLSKTVQQSYKMLPKLDTNGDPEKIKTGKRVNGKDFKEERKALETHIEFYIEDKEEILQFLGLTAINSKEFSLDQYFKSILNPEMGIEKPKIELVSK